MRVFASPIISTIVTLLRCVAVKAESFPSAGTVGVTPHDSYSSSTGVLGCKVNTNRIAYWPPSPDCTNICLSLTYGSRNVKLLRIDQSGGAYDISYDAWNYLYTGHSATDDPVAGGAVEMTYQEVGMSECEDLIYTHGHKLPFSAANSMNFVSSCLKDPDSWVARNYALYNILDPICTMGRDEECELKAGSNQPTCPHTLGEVGALKGDTVWNLAYPSGKRYKAGTQPPAPQGVISEEGDGEGGSNRLGGKGSWLMMAALSLVVVLRCL